MSKIKADNSLSNIVAGVLEDCTFATAIADALTGSTGEYYQMTEGNIERLCYHLYSMLEKMKDDLEKLNRILQPEKAA